MIYMDKMLNVFGILLGTLCFSLPIIVAAIFGIRARLKTIAEISRNRAEGRYDKWNDPVLEKRLRLMGFVQLVLLTVFIICLLIMLTHPSQPVLSILVSIWITIMPMMFIIGSVLERLIIRGKGK
jgi:hypothetical protein